MSSYDSNKQYYEGEVASHAQAFTSMDPERDAVKQAASDSVARPAQAKVEDRSGRETDAATNQQFDAGGKVRQ